METKKLEKIEMSVSIKRKNADGESTAQLIISELGNLSVDLTTESVEDIKELFKKVFDYIVSEKKIIQFKVEDGINDLFFDVSNDVITQINREIQQSEDNFLKIFSLT